MTGVDLAPGQDDGLTRELHRRSLAQFVADFWDVLHPPSEPYVHNWHIDTLCDHLQAVTEGKIRRLLINIPFGMSKSVLVNVFWPAWEMGPRNMPSTKYMMATYEKERLGKRDVDRMKAIVKSDRYQRLYGDRVRINPKKDTNEMFANTAGGWREVRPMAGLTGGRANRVVIDDPHSVSQAESETERENAVRLFAESVESRLNDPRRDAIVVIMQRLHERDVAGHIIEQMEHATSIPWDHICIPMRYETDHPYPTRSSIGFVDPRTEDGELMFPERFSEEVVSSYEQTMTEYASAGQLQQRPEPRGGGMVPVHVIWKEGLRDKEPRHADLESLVRYWDKACLVSGTPVRTSRGSMPIEHVVEGDSVLTRNGYARVTGSWLSKYAHELTTVILSDGRTLTGTPDHPVFTRNRFWVDLSRLVQSDVLLDAGGVPEWEGREDQTSKNDFSTDADTCATRRTRRRTCLEAVISSATRGIRKRVSIAIGRCIATSGSTTTAPYPVAITSTTRTETGTTTTSRILSASRPVSTGAGTRTISRTRLRSLIRSIEKSHRQRFEPESRSPSSTSAKTAGPRSRQRVSRLSSVLHAAGRGLQRLLETGSGLKQKLTKGLAYRASLTPSVENAETVAPGSRPRTCTHAIAPRADTSATRHVNEGPAPGGVPVYDLTVEGEHEFFANGVLVHNSTHQGGAYTAGVLMARLKDDAGWFVLDVVRGQWGSTDRDRAIVETAERDAAYYGKVTIYMEREPGSAGKDSYRATAAQLAGHPVYEDPVAKSKTERMEGLASQVGSGNVYVLNRRWTDAFLTELGKFPVGRYRDQADAAAGAFNRLLSKGRAGALGSNRNRKRRR